MHYLRLRFLEKWTRALHLAQQCLDVPGHPKVRLLLLLGVYTVVLQLSRWMAYQLKFDFAPGDAVARQLFYSSPWVLTLKLAALYICGQFNGLLSYYSIPDLRRLAVAVSTSTVVLVMATMWVGEATVAPYSVLVMDYVLTLGGLSGARLTLRILRARNVRHAGVNKRRGVRVGIIGAGDAGAILARELASKTKGRLPVAFFDDDPNKWRSRVHEIPVIGAPELAVARREELGLEEIIIAMPSAPARRIGEIVDFLTRAGVKFRTVPSLEQLTTGQVEVSHLRKVEIEDLLGRKPVALDEAGIRQELAGRVVMVTGAGGSIGSELCRQIASFGPSKLLLVERSEGHLFEVQQELVGVGYAGISEALVADITDLERMEGIFAQWHPEVVFHAAAHKHVPLMESQPAEAFTNNALGTAQLAELSLRHGVDRFILISTDKAINPTNVMGSTKRMAEKYIQALHAANPSRTKFMAVRFGNVLGSSGSVIPTFRRQIEAGGPVRVTHPDMTRYFMTIPEAVGLVLQSASLGQGGEIFLLDMGQPVKIVDLARQMILLSGLQPDRDIEIQFVGLRPGEKLFEELTYEAENSVPTKHEKVFKLLCDAEPLEELQQQFVELTASARVKAPSVLKQHFKAIVPEYRPFAA